MTDLTKADAVAALRRALKELPSGHAASEGRDAEIKRDAATLRALADAIEYGTDWREEGDHLYWIIPAPRLP